jgi:hypothetical protein
MMYQITIGLFMHLDQLNNASKNSGDQIYHSKQAAARLE